jgi:hypothetical protein
VTACGCAACAALLAECGPDLFGIYSRKLLVKGWSGQYSPVERAYVAAHRSEARQRDAKRRAETLRAAISHRQQPRLPAKATIAASPRSRQAS